MARRRRRRPKRVTIKKVPKAVLREERTEPDKPSIVRPPNWNTVPLEIERYIRKGRIEGYERVKDIYIAPLNLTWRPGFWLWVKLRVKYLFTKHGMGKWRSYGLFLDWLAAVYLKNMVKGIIAQDGWLMLRELSDAWLERKHKIGFDHRVLIASAHYINSLRKFSRGATLVIEAKNLPHPNAEGLTYDKLAQILEFGTKKMISIPHWRPVRSKIVNNIKQLLIIYFETDDLRDLPDLAEIGTW